MKQLHYDYTFMNAEFVGEHGITPEQTNSLFRKIQTIRREKFIDQAEKYGFMRLPYDAGAIDQISQLANQVQEKFDTLIVLGIGGSDLGARAVIAALPSSTGMKMIFLGANTDPVEIVEKLEHINWHKTAVNVISKSGDTIETMSTFLYVRDQLIGHVGKDSYADHIIATTDAVSGTLKTIANREGYRTLVVPADVGGRFSVLSSVGLFPIACAGADIHELCHGAREMCDSLINTTGDEWHASEMFAALHFSGFTSRQQNIHVFIPYAAALREIGQWFRQLWAESLGKKETIDGRIVYTGPTPVAALGATDQHSQFQLYYFGPYDKIVTFVDILDYGSELTVPGAFSDIEGVAYMDGLSFQKIIRTELQSSALALTERMRPNGRLVLADCSAFSVGQLLQFLEISTVYMGHLLEINPFDQPGVELGKQNMYALFNRSGYEKRQQELENLMKNYEKYSI